MLKHCKLEQLHRKTYDTLEEWIVIRNEIVAEKIRILKEACAGVCSKNEEERKILPALFDYFMYVDDRAEMMFEDLNAAFETFLFKELCCGYLNLDCDCSIPRILYGHKQLKAFRTQTGLDIISGEFRRELKKRPRFEFYLGLDEMQKTPISPSDLVKFAHKHKVVVFRDVLRVANNDPPHGKKTLMELCELLDSVSPDYGTNISFIFAQSKLSNESFIWSPMAKRRIKAAEMCDYKMTPSLSIRTIFSIWEDEIKH